MSGIWFYRALGQQYGPLGTEELRTLARSGLLRPDTPVRQGRDGSWTVAGQMQGLFSDDPPESVVPVPPTVAATPPAAAVFAEPPPLVTPGSLSSIVVDVSGQGGEETRAVTDFQPSPGEPVVSETPGQRWLMARNVLLWTTCGLVVLVLLAWFRPLHHDGKRASQPAPAVAVAARPAERAASRSDVATTPRKVAPAASGPTPQQRFEQFAKEIDARLAETLKQTIEDYEENKVNAARGSGVEWRSLGTSQQDHHGEVWESVAAEVQDIDKPATVPSGTLSFAWAGRVGDYLPILSVVRWKCSYVFDDGHWKFKSARATVVKAAPFGMDTPEKELLSGDVETLQIAAETQCLEWLNPAFNRPILRLLQGSTGY